MSQMKDKKNPDWLNSVELNGSSVEIKIEPGRDDEFYRAFGLEPGDDTTLNEILTRELSKFIEEKKNESGT
jgi:hypothetical protein